MARIRTIKPEFFTSEDIVELEPLARLLYIAIWCECDKEGRLQWKPRTLKMRYFPADKCDIEKLCGELINSGLVITYGNGYAYVPSFNKHQHINPRESVSTLPEPDNYYPPAPKRISIDVRASVMERDGNQCVRCNSSENLTLDHILPQSMGGPHIAENLRVLCRPCNSGRPVSGEALHADLREDGHTVDSLRVKFGIDASARVGTRDNLDLHRENPELHAQGGREGKGREGNTRNALMTAFDKFWIAYPKKAGKGDAEKAWLKIKPDADLQNRIFAAVAIAAHSIEWAKDAGQFIPHPATWLNGKRWEDGASSTVVTIDGEAWRQDPRFRGMK